MKTNVSPKDFRICEAKILKNALDIIYHTGLLRNEVIELNVGDVMSNGSIVSAILPLSDSYPKGFEKMRVIISNDARKLIENHIMYLQANEFSISPKSALFPDAKTRKSYDKSKLWRFLSTYCIYDNYERHRVAGIHQLCWELSQKGVQKQQIVSDAHQFSRYSNRKRTQKLVSEGMSINPKKYENVYLECRDAASRLIAFHEMFPNKVNQYISDFQRDSEILFDRDKKTMLKKVNEGLFKTKKKLVEREDSLVIEEITEVRISPKMIKRKKRRKHY
jgi:hypothetical protein